MASSGNFKVADILMPVSGRLLHGNPDVRFNNFCIDSRYVDDKSIFIPLMGQNRDGHQYALDSISKGAVAAFVRSGHHQVHEIVSWLRERSSRGFHDYEEVCIIEVRHTLVAMQKLAEWYRRQFPAKVVAITGSVGKTGTKEMLIQLLSTKFHTVGTEKNFNNEIGVPLALAKINTHTKFAVVEMAMRARGEISLLSRIAHPDMALITNTSVSHVGRLGSFEEVYKAKCEIVDGLLPGSTIFLNRRDGNMKKVVEEINMRGPEIDDLKLRTFDSSGAFNGSGVHPFIAPGSNNGVLPADMPPEVWIEDVQQLGLEGSEFLLCTPAGKVKTRLRMLGRGAIENFAAATVVALALGMSPKELAEAAEDLLPAPQRLNLFKLRENLFLIDDCYNSSPASAQDSLELMLSIDPKFRKILVVGDMLELGKYETILHRQYALNVLNLPFDTVYAVGPRMNAVNEIEGRDDIDLYYIAGQGDTGPRDFDNEPRFSTSFGASFGSRQMPRQEPTVILDDRAASKLSALLLNQLEQSNQPTVLLVKGSRALHFERIVNDLLSGSIY